MIASVLATLAASPPSDPVSAATILQYASGALNLGLGGVMIWLFLNGKLHSDTEMSAARDDLTKTQAALERTREALMLSSARNETGILSAEIIAQALGTSRRSRRDEDDDRRQERRDQDDDRRSERRGEDDDRRGSRATEDDEILSHPHPYNRHLEGRADVPQED